MSIAKIAITTRSSIRVIPRRKTIGGRLCFINGWRGGRRDLNTSAKGNGRKNKRSRSSNKTDKSGNFSSRHRFDQKEAEHRTSSRRSFLPGFPFPVREPISAWYEKPGTTVIGKRREILACTSFLWPRQRAASPPRHFISRHYSQTM